jgi:hypothetical protein
MLSIGFLKLFLHWKEVMTLEEAARKLSSISIDDHKIKTKVKKKKFTNKIIFFYKNKKFYQINKYFFI